MTKIKEKWSDYSLREKIAIVIGSGLLSIQGFKYATNDLGSNAVEISVFTFGFLLLFAPIVLVELIKKRKNAA